MAIVGSRAATPYALDVGGAAWRASWRSAASSVVSGLARGVDSAAHRGCLDAGGPTVAVLGSGLDRSIRRSTRPRANDLQTMGLLVSELGPGAPPLPEHFPLRNRIISGISLAVVVVEASEKSGSLITARCALEQGRDVMAVPGSVLTGRNRGSHALLKDGAKVVETADDILEELGWPAARGGRRDASLNSLTSDPLLARMERRRGVRLDELVDGDRHAGASKLLPRLMELELQGLREPASGGGTVRPSRTGPVDGDEGL